MLPLLGYLPNNRALQCHEEVLNRVKAEGTNSNFASEDEVIIGVKISRPQNRFVVIKLSDLCEPDDFKCILVLVMPAQRHKPRKLFNELNDLFKIRHHPFRRVWVGLVQFDQFL